MKMQIPLRIDFIEFLELVKVIKMLYGRDIAEKFFTYNIKRWYNVDSASMINSKNEE